MGLFQKLKAALGLDGAESPERGRRDVDVTVEREPSVESEDAVKGTETATTGSGTSDEPVDDGGIEDAETTGEAGESSVDDAEPAIDEAEPSVDDSESSFDDSEPTVDETESTVDDSEPDVEDVSTAEETAGATDEEAGDGDAPAADAEATEGSTDPVTEITGIGPAYGQRLEDAGVETVADLAGADADELAAATDVSATRIEGWIDAAKAY